MTDPRLRRRTPATGAAGAGILLLTTVLLLGAAGAGLGALVGSVPLLLIAGVLAGFFVGTWVVYRRFRDL